MIKALSVLVCMLVSADESGRLFVQQHLRTCLCHNNIHWLQSVQHLTHDIEVEWAGKSAARLCRLSGVPTMSRKMRELGPFR